MRARPGLPLQEGHAVHGWKASLAGQLQPLKRDFDPHPPGSREAARAKRPWSKRDAPGGLCDFSSMGVPGRARCLTTTFS